MTENLVFHEDSDLGWLPGCTGRYSESYDEGGPMLYAEVRADARVSQAQCDEIKDYMFKKHYGNSIAGGASVKLVREYVPSPPGEWKGGIPDNYCGPSKKSRVWAAWAIPLSVIVMCAILFMAVNALIGLP